MSIAFFVPIGDWITLPMPDWVGAGVVTGAAVAWAAGVAAGVAPGATTDLPMTVGAALPGAAVDFGMMLGAGAATAFPTGAAGAAGAEAPRLSFIAPRSIPSMGASPGAAKANPAVRNTAMVLKRRAGFTVSHFESLNWKV